MSQDSLIAVAMSGGVDSSVAAGLLSRAGRPLVGFSMQLIDRLAGATERYGRCCSPDDFRDARAVADRLGFAHYVLDMEEEFERHVLAPFADDYARARTPSPCVRCNTFMKFGALLSRARAVGAEKVATGHYAQLVEDRKTGRRVLRRAADPAKDQSYFLFDLSQEQLRRAEFPLGAMKKEDVREAARAMGLGTAEKPESMDLCFVAKGDDYRELLDIRETGGEIVDVSGRILGKHDGISGFTVGQRKGIAVAAKQRLYVVAIDAASRRVVVGEEHELYRETCTLERTRYLPFEHPGGPLRATIKIRSTHPGVAATIEDQGGGGARLRFDEPQRSVTPGQAAVFYDGDLVLGGGWISG